MKPDLDIAILGAGFSGIGLGISLLQAGRSDFAILEQEDEIGGTWRDNTYPGAGCDTESHLYCFSFGLNLAVSRVYARQPEILAYMHRLVAENALKSHIRLGNKVSNLRWDDANRLWHITLSDGQMLTARNFAAGWGQLNRPQIPVIPGQANFAGPAFHSARWRHDVDTRGKRVGSIGNAASAVQYIPEIAPGAKRLTVFQRSPNWIVPRLDRAYTQSELHDYRTIPDHFAAHRRELFAWRESTFLRMKAGSADALEVEQIALAHLAEQVPDPDLRAKLTPDYPLGCKRILRSDDYYPAIARSNVSLVTSPIERIVPEGVVTVDSVLHEMDILIYGTGFETRSFQGPMDIHGRSGRDLRRVWQGGANAYLGIFVAGFPNFFLLYGPNTNLGHNSVLMMLEAQFGAILQALAWQDEVDGAALDVREDVMAEYDAAVQAQMDDSAWAGNCNSWYKDPNGRVINNWFGTVEKYQEMINDLDRSVFNLVG
jgi:cation diffusion facilitator CzcD-associated flavoprotein CzcO